MIAAVGAQRKRLLVVLVALVSLLYPALVYIGVGRVSPLVFALILAGVGFAKFYFADGVKDKSQWLLLSVAVVYSAMLAFSGSDQLLRLYPAVISVCLGAAFVASLYQRESLIERLARLAGETITQRAKRYTGRLSLIWGLLLFANAAVATYLAYFGSLELWALYTGLLSYAIFAVFFALEFLYRQFYMSKYRHEQE